MPLLEQMKQHGYGVLDGYSVLAVKALNAAREFYNFPDPVRAAIMADFESGVLGYYPSEQEASRWRESNLACAEVFGSMRSRGYCSFDCLVNEKVVGSSPIIALNKWPGDRIEWCGLAEQIYREFVTIGQAVSIDLARLACPHSADELLKGLASGECCSLMRVLLYNQSEAIGVSKAHTDYELVTLIASDGRGLQVRNKEGEWCDVIAEPGQLVVLPGDLMGILSAGLVPATPHRVAFGQQQRNSVVFFQGLPSAFSLSEYVSSEKPQTFGAHLLGMLARGAAHLSGKVDELESFHGFKIPERNPFRIW